MPHIESIGLSNVQVWPGAARRWLFVELQAADGRTGLAEATS